ncbi:MAG: cbb3-type cytochrome c oxidase subunit I [Candidatus Cyclonatronum sp.]|uniref:cbb3-type cytochrome c oxidase subunit I n=1 Tax=Cyclonatronum sp. TaxID=3024185 RepID=UPI0025C480F6|nr:cbb3-type cytochrome c oxidase subunit I [Cyclonatronum sp.]MCC5935253.1 cbb3-type cytochrome c oxidase subunit I [Balneolales bacterium]MCH8485819.1 cbb3-type cytochrome c oxidase subunit I [Cyclonatronum sp.]
MSTTHFSEIDSSAQSIRFLDEKARNVVLFLIVSGVFWLLFGSLLALLASIKMHAPDWLGQWSFLTFGRVRPLHLNTMVYGWASMTGAGVALWLLSRMLRVAIPMRPYIAGVTVIWNLALVVGSFQILAGYTRGIEWLEFPVSTMIVIVWCILVIGIAAMLMLFNRNVQTLYVSVWYLIAAFLWLPLLGGVSSLPIFNTPTVQAGMNWWFAHNALGLWFTPIGLAAAYYFIPKVIGRPIYSYGLSLLGFWGLALFYNWNGFHHLIGSPLPTWFITISIAASVMMIIPVIVVAVNHHMTIVGSFSAVKYSPTLRFVVFAAMSYTFVSLQGSIQALRSVNEVIHFTHFVVAHAHIGMYAFVTMMLFGSCYYILPRLTNWEWQSGKLIKLHFWLTALGIILYTFPLQVGGVLQGLAMNNPDITFSDTVTMTIPYLITRSVAGVMLTAGHLIFAYLVIRIVARVGLRPAVPESWNPKLEEARS